MFHVYQQSSVIPIIVDNGQFKILLVNNRSQTRWIFPKGIIESELNAVESAQKEALEEAGITGTVLNQPIGKYYYQKNDSTHQVFVYIMIVDKILDKWPESGFRKRKYVNEQELLEILDDRIPYDMVDDMLKTAKERIYKRDSKFQTLYKKIALKFNF